MAKKKEKMKTPDWIIEGYDSKADWEKKKGISSEKKVSNTFKIKVCPKCNGDDVGLVLSNSDAEEGGGKEWECRKCKWVGVNINEKQLTEDEFMKYLDDKGEEVA